MAHVRSDMDRGPAAAAFRGPQLQCAGCRLLARVAEGGLLKAWKVHMTHRQMWTEEQLLQPFADHLAAIAGTL